MNVWYYISTIFNRLNVLRFAVPILLCVALITTLFLANSAQAAPSTNKPINFQGKLLRSNGGVVPDGYYNMQFKIYEGGSGASANNPDGTLAWTENHVNNNANGGVRVKNGHFTVNLGTKNQFGSSVDWDSDTLWLSMNVAGNAANCTSFGGASCIGDGEMLPMKQITATPFSLNSGAVGGKTADDLVQLGQGVQTDSSNNSSIFINKIGTGNLLQLQAGGQDAFAINSIGQLTLGSTAEQSISVAQSDSGSGKSLTVESGSAATGSNQAGGDLILQGGAGDGSGPSGGVVIKSNDTNSASALEVQNAAGEAVLSVDTATNTVSIGNLDIASGLETDEISTTGNLDISSGGDISVGSTTGNLSMQGNTVNIEAINGGNVNIQGGDASTSDSNGGNIVLSGGAGNGTGAKGLVVIDTPTFSTTSNDANCYTSGAMVASSCTIAQSSINNSAAIIVGMSASEQTVTVPDPTIKTAGRVTYISAVNGSETFTLRANVGAGAPELNLSMNENETMMLFWNGSDWTKSGGGSGGGGTTLQAAYDSTPQTANGTEVVVSGESGGLTIRESESDPVGNNILQVQDSKQNQVFSVNTQTNLASDGSVSDPANFSLNWQNRGGAATSATYNSQEGKAAPGSVEVVSAFFNGGENILKAPLKPNASYRISVQAKLVSATTFDSFTIRYFRDGAYFKDCTTQSTDTLTSEWAEITCDLTTDSSTPTTATLAFVQAAGLTDNHTFLIDDLKIVSADSPQNVKIGGGESIDGGTPTLFTLDGSSSAPTGSAESLLGSMYYDTSLGRVQCYEAEGWGSCGASPDTFVSISPEYTGAVMNGADIGTITSDLCSDTLNINDGSSGQPNICGTNETYNFYNWTSAESTDQVRSIFVTYKLPTNFKEFVEESTSLIGRTDSANADVSYNVYRDSLENGLITCGSQVAVSTGSQTSWQTGTASNGADPSTCGFQPGESILIRINLSAHTDANAYVSNLKFIFSNY